MLKNLSDNLNILMAKARLNSSELARLTGLPATTIKRIRNNEQSNPTISTLLPIAKYFSLTISELLQCETTNTHITFGMQKGLKALPLLSWRECVHFDLLDYTKCPKTVLTERSLSDKSYSLVVEDCDLDFFPKQCHLIVDPNIDPECGDYIITAKSEQGTASIKKYIVETDQVYLKSLVDGLGITPLTSEYKILGVIVQCKIELRKENQ
jgi:transcriptional regulator with XRE-family HTH domain